MNDWGSYFEQQDLLTIISSSFNQSIIIHSRPAVKNFEKNKQLEPRKYPSIIPSNRKPCSIKLKKCSGFALIISFSAYFP